MKKICVVTSARSEYGLLRWLMDEIKNEPTLKLQIVVTGSHLSNEFGYTYREIEKDGFVIDEKIEFLITSDTKKSIATSMGVCAIGLAGAFERLRPDMVVVLGDRYELLPICSTALVMNIPVAHISGGDVTKGAIDDQVRNAISQISSIHFPGTKESAKRIIRMGINPQKVFTVGEPGIDNFLRLPKLKKKKLAQRFGLFENSRWILLTYHPETKISLEENLVILKNIFTVLFNLKNVQVIMTKANADFGGIQINEFLIEIARTQNNFVLVDNLGQTNYVNVLRHAWFMIGNSSSGIIEAPVIPLPVVNVGKRQAGRFFCKNVLCSDGTPKSLSKTINKISALEYVSSLKDISSPYGDGRTCKRIKNILKKQLADNTIND